MSNTYLVTTLDGGSWGFDPIRRTARFNEVKSVTPHDVYLATDLAFAREMGQKEAWELAGRFLKSVHEGGYKVEDVDDMFGKSMTACGPIVDYSYTEAAAKVSEWKKKKRINVGDVYSDEHGSRVLVTFVSPAIIYYMYMDGSCGNTMIKVFREKFPIKTDRHIDISNIIDRLQED